MNTQQVDEVFVGRGEETLFMFRNHPKTRNVILHLFSSFLEIHKDLNAGILALLKFYCELVLSVSFILFALTFIQLTTIPNLFLL